MKTSLKPRLHVTPFIVLGVCFLVSISPRAEAELPAVALQPVSLGELESPVCIATPPDGTSRLLICEQRGEIRILQDGRLLPEPFLDLSAKLIPERPGFDERGLLGLAFHPHYTNSTSAGYRRFYVFYTAESPNAPGTTNQPVDCRSIVAEYQVSAANANIADAGSERILLAFDKPQFNHNGGQLDFGPDGLLYISTGDGGGANDNRAGHTGGYVYRGSAIPELIGVYVFGDWSSSFGTPNGTLLGMEETATNIWSFGLLPVVNGNPVATRIMAFGRDQMGELYVATKVTLAPSQGDPATGLPSGAIYKIIPTQTNTVSVGPTKDNSIFSEDGSLSMALGDLFAGRTEAEEGFRLYATTHALAACS